MLWFRELNHQMLNAKVIQRLKMIALQSCGAHAAGAPLTGFDKYPKSMTIGTLAVRYTCCNRALAFVLVPQPGLEAALAKEKEQKAKEEKQKAAVS